MRTRKPHRTSPRDSPKKNLIGDNRESFLLSEPSHAFPQHRSPKSHIIKLVFQQRLTTFEILLYFLRLLHASFLFTFSRHFGRRRLRHRCRRRMHSSHLSPRISAAHFHSAFLHRYLFSDEVPTTSCEYNFPFPSATRDCQ